MLLASESTCTLLSCIVLWLTDRPEPVRTTALVLASSKIIALMLSEQRIASLSTRFPSSKLQLRADNTIHMSHMLILHVRKWARFNGVPYVRTHTVVWQHTNTTAFTASAERSSQVVVIVMLMKNIIINNCTFCSTENAAVWISLSCSTNPTWMYNIKSQRVATDVMKATFLLRRLLCSFPSLLLLQCYSTHALLLCNVFPYCVA